VDGFQAIIFCLLYSEGNQLMDQEDDNGKIANAFLKLGKMKQHQGKPRYKDQTCY